MSNRARDAFHEELQKALTEVETAIEVMFSRRSVPHQSVYDMRLPDGSMALTPLLLAKSNLLLAISNLPDDH